MREEKQMYEVITCHGDVHGFNSLRERSKFITSNPHLFGHKSIIQGVSKDEPIIVNSEGGGQSRVLYRMDLLDPKAILATAKVLQEGAEKYGEENWRLISMKEHINHMLIHAYAYLAGDESDEHLAHITCRALFALGVELQTVEDLERVTKLKQQGGTQDVVAHQ